MAEKDLLFSENSFLLFHPSFLQVKTATDTSWNKESTFYKVVVPNT